MNELAKKEPTPIANVPADNVAEVGQLIKLSIEKGFDPKELMAIYREGVAMRAKSQYDEAVSRFRAECPPFPKRLENTQFQVTRGGVKRHTRYADLDDIQATIDPVMSKFGLSYRWGDTVISNTGDGTLMTQDCILSHVGGHKESSSVSCPTESKAGASPAQKWMSAGTYCRRYSLIAVAGLKGCDDDDDGQNAGGEAANNETITADEVRDLGDALLSLNADKARFCKAMGVIGLTDIRRNQLDRAWELIEKKRKAEAK